MTDHPYAAVFLDRDGVLIEDTHLLTRAEDMRILPGVPAALIELREELGFWLIMVSNQPVVARGLATESEVEALHATLAALLAQDCATLDAMTFCPHHPNANVPAYRIDCECRKPRPGLLLRAADQYGIVLDQSWMIGDRLSDIGAGKAAGCRTILLETGMHDQPLIQSGAWADLGEFRPDFTCASLPDAVAIIKEEG